MYICMVGLLSSHLGKRNIYPDKSDVVVYAKLAPFKNVDRGGCKVQTYLGPDIRGLVEVLQGSHTLALKCTSCPNSSRVSPPERLTPAGRCRNKR